MMASLVILGKVALAPTIFGMTNELEKFSGKVTLEDYALGAEKAWDELLFAVEAGNGKKLQCKVVYEDRGKPPVPDNVASDNDSVNSLLKKSACFYEIQAQVEHEESLKNFIHFIALYFTKICKGIIYDVAEEKIYTLDEYIEKQ